MTTAIKVQVSGLELCATLEGQGPAVLLLHGIPGAGHVWRDVRRRLSSRHLVITPDLLGFGESSRTEELERLWVRGQAEALLALLDELSLDSVVIVGHDYGGPVASELLSLAPGRVSGLALLACNVFPDTPIPFPLSGLRWPLVGRAWARVLFSAPSLGMMTRLGQGRPGGVVDVGRAVGDAEQAAAIRLLFTTALLEIERRYEGVRDALREIGLPAVVLWGDRDPFFSVDQGRRTAALLGADVPCMVLSEAGHFLPEERPDDVASAVADLARRASA